MSLTLKQSRFVDAYMAYANATEAARRAGYQGDAVTLASVGYENLRKPQIMEAIRSRVEADDLVADRRTQQRFWTAIMLGPEYDMNHRLRASELLCKSQGGFAPELSLPSAEGEAKVYVLQPADGESLSDVLRSRMQ